MNNVEVKVIQIYDIVLKEIFLKVTPLIIKFWNKYNLDAKIFKHENNGNSQNDSNGTLKIPTKTLSINFDNIQKYNFVKMQQDTLF